MVNRSELLEKLYDELDHLPKELPTDTVMKIAIVGKRNAGKKHVYQFAGRGPSGVIASEVPGTTRDAVDVHFEKARAPVYDHRHGRGAEGRQDEG